MTDKKNFFYRGRSMRGTFRNGDYLNVSPVRINNIKIGDIVVFESDFNGKQKKKLIVHRVISIIGNEITTRGDYNLFNDRDTLNADYFLGKVLSCERKGEKIEIANGFKGRLRAKRIRLELLIKKRMFSLINPIYSLIKKTKVVPKFWKPNLKTIILDSKNGQKIKYTHHGKTVIVLEGKNIIFKRRPYDLLF